MKLLSISISRALNRQDFQCVYRHPNTTAYLYMLIMDHELSLPVDYKGKELEFPFSMVAAGYIYRFVVQIGEAEVVFERDEGGELRAPDSKPGNSYQSTAGSRTATGYCGDN